MSDETKDSAPGAPEPVELPTPQVSEPSGGQPGSAPALDADAIVKRVVEQLEPMVERTFQKAKDRRFSTLDKLGDIAPLVEFKQYLEKNKGDYEAALRDFRIDQVLAREPAPVPVQGRTEDEATKRLKDEISEDLTEAGIRYDDPEIQALAAKQYPSLAPWARDVRKVIARRAKQAKPAGAENAVPDGGTGTPPDAASKAEKLDRLYARLELMNRNPSAYGAEYDQVQLDIDKLESSA